MSTAYILPFGSTTTAPTTLDGTTTLDTTHLWAQTPQPKDGKLPTVGTTRTFYNTPPSPSNSPPSNSNAGTHNLNLTTLTSLSPAYPTAPPNQKRELVRKAIGSAIKEISKLEGVETVRVDAALDPHAAAVASHLALYKFTLKTASPSPLNPVATLPPPRASNSLAPTLQAVPPKFTISPLQGQGQLQLQGKESEEWERGVVYAQAQNLARTLMELPANILTPTTFCERVVHEFEGIEDVKIYVRDEEWARQQGMTAFLSVAQGTSEPARFLEIHYDPPTSKCQDPTSAPAPAPLAFVGKGITFDSGGISLKPGAGMKLMRGDMGGAATVVASTWAIAKLGIPIKLITVTPLTENMPGPGATKPGDVFLQPPNSIEVDNTDAEGRLVLASALSYISSTYKPKKVLDVATLTGACVIALGEVFSAVFSNSDPLWHALHAAGEKEHDRFWRMPLDEEYAVLIGGSNADLQNTGGKAAGACTAALFLRPFALGSSSGSSSGSTDIDIDKPETPSIEWAHIDIAGSMESTRGGAYQEKGMTGRPVRALVEFVRGLV